MITAVERELAQLRTENAQLKHALHSRILIEQAKGLVAGAAGVDMDEAFDLIRTFGRSDNQNIHLLCAAIIEAATGARAASPICLSKTPLYADIMTCWHNRARTPSRHRKMPAR